MQTVAIIPARGGSKRLPRKNILPLAGRPLIAYTIEQAVQSIGIQRVIVSTDDAEIATISKQYGAEIAIRPPHLSADEATSESALLHVLESLRERENYNPDLVVFLQGTSPLRERDDVDNGIDTLVRQNADSLFSACRFNKYLWHISDGRVRSINFDYENERWREQDFPTQFQENGSIYVLKPWVLKEKNYRFSGRIAIYEMDYWSSFQIDSQEDLELCEWILQKRRQRDNATALPRPVKGVIFDFDGVFTDNRVVVHQDGTESVLCDRADSLRISELKAAGVAVAVLSTEKNPVVSARCAKLGIPCYQGVRNKYELIQRLLGEFNISREHLIYVGNDLNDLECIQRVGCAVAVADAHPMVRAAARITLKCPGGRGAVRELCDLVLQTLGT